MRGPWPGRAKGGMFFAGGKGSAPWPRSETAAPPTVCGEGRQVSDTIVSCPLPPRTTSTHKHHLRQNPNRSIPYAYSFLERWKK